jgi:DNA-binding response OmpR family regulator
MERRPHVFVVDDQADISDLLVNFLEESDYRATGLDSAAALRLRLVEADLVILDAMLREESGIDLAAEIRAAGIPVIMMTGHFAAMERLRQLSYPTVHKPFRLGDLLALVAKTLAAKS